MSFIKLTKIKELEGFKAYDIRAVVPDQLDVVKAYRIALAFANWGNLRSAVVGHDIRQTSPELATAVINGLTDAGVEVFDLGLCGTEQVYFATAYFGCDGGIMVTASHNPIQYNGMKFVAKMGVPIGLDSGLAEIKALALAGECQLAAKTGQRRHVDCLSDYLNHLLSLVNIADIKPIRVLVDPGNGGAGHVLSALQRYLPIELIGINMPPDGSFPVGVPNPMLVEQQARTSLAVLENGADIGVSWDGDFDRCFFFDELGQYIDPYYVVGLLSEAFLSQTPGERIVHDIRLAWNSEEVIKAAGGVSCPSNSGHSYMKATMRKADAIYGGETTGHHYFRDFYYCDSGILPYLMMLKVLSGSDLTLSQRVAARKAAFPCSGEINLAISRSAQSVIAAIEKYYEDECQDVNYLDGLSMSFAEWRFNLRSSNTEPLLRLNIESRGDERLVALKRDELLALIGGFDQSDGY